jgi:hypothetical protein
VALLQYKVTGTKKVQSTTKSNILFPFPFFPSSPVSRAFYVKRNKEIFGKQKIIVSDNWLKIIAIVNRIMAARSY